MERQSLTGKQPPGSCPLDFCSDCNYEQPDTELCVIVSVIFQILCIPCFLFLVLL